MSKLDNIILECANKVLDGKEEKLGDYIDPTKQQIILLILEIIGEDSPRQIDNSSAVWENALRHELRKKVEAL